MESILIPIFVCVVCPVAIVLIVALTAINRENKRAAVLMKAIEANPNFDPNILAEALKKPTKTPRQQSNSQLLRGSICTLLGIFFGAMGIYNYATLPADMSDDSAFAPTLLGCISLAVGIGYLITYFANRKQVETDETV